MNDSKAWDLSPPSKEEVLKNRIKTLEEENEKFKKLFEVIFDLFYDKEIVPYHAYLELMKTVRE